MTPAEELLSERFNRGYARLTANGTTALYLALKYAREVLGAKRVFFPEITCQAAVNSAILNGCAIGAVDVERDHFIVRDSMFQTSNCEPSVFVKTDIFGFPTEDADMARFPSNTFVVEDKAQGFFTNISTPSNQATVLSFGLGKHIDIGTGGALLFDSSELAAFVDGQLNLMPESVSVNNAEFYPALFELQKKYSGDRFRHERNRLIRGHKWQFIGRFAAEKEKELVSALQSADKTYELKIENQYRLEKEMAAVTGIQTHLFNDHLCWRYPLLTDSVSRDALYRALIGSGIAVSKLFQPVSSDNLTGEPCGENAAKFFSRALILNDVNEYKKISRVLKSAS